MDLVRKEKEITIEKEEFIMTFDMRSIATYKELVGEPFTLGVHKLFKYDDTTLINFIASTLRRKKEPSKPLGQEVIEGDILYFLLNHTADVIEIVAKSLPESSGVSKKK